MTMADKIRKLVAKGLTNQEIADKLGCTRKHVVTVKWEDANRGRVRELRASWNRKARSNPSYRKAELATQAESRGGYVRGPHKPRDRSHSFV